MGGSKLRSWRNGSLTETIPKLGDQAGDLRGAVNGARKAVFTNDGAIIGVDAIDGDEERGELGI